MWRKNSLYSWVQSVNTDRHWTVVGSCMPVKSACVFRPCQVEASKRTILIFNYTIPNKCVVQLVYKINIRFRIQVTCFLFFSAFSFVVISQRIAQNTLVQQESSLK